MVTKTITEQRAEVRIFAGNDPAHTATGSSGISSATPALTPLMLDEATGKLVVWDGQKAGSAVGILVYIPLISVCLSPGMRKSRWRGRMRTKC